MRPTPDSDPRFRPSVSAPAYRSDLLKTHCVVWSRSVRNGSFITVRSNHRWTPVIGDVRIWRNPASGAFGSAHFRRQHPRSTSCGTAAMQASARTSRSIVEHALPRSWPSIRISRTPQRSRTSPPRLFDRHRGNLRKVPRAERTGCPLDNPCGSRETPSRTRRFRSAHPCGPALRRAR